MQDINIYKPIVTTFETNEQLYDSASNLAINHLLNIIGDKGFARVALSGGSTPLPLYTKLFNSPFIQPESIEVYQTDERYVPTTSDDSNQKQILSAIDENSQYFKELHLIKTDLPLEEATKNYSEVIDSLEEPIFDLCILGIGEDGHFASLFPGGDYLNGFQPKAIHTTTKTNKIRDRISVSPDNILQSEMILVVLTGEKKRHIVPEILEGKKSAIDFPAKFLLCHPNVSILESFED
jgi:6-phosphogluconolactonase